MGTKPPASTSSGTVILVVALTAVGLLIVLAACAGGAFFLIWRTAARDAPARQEQQNKAVTYNLQQSTGVASLFLDAVLAGRAREAYQQTSRDFQMRQSFEEFQAFLDKNPGLRKGTSRFIAPGAAQGPGPTQSALSAAVVGLDAIVSCDLLLVNEDGQWKVDRFTVTATQQLKSGK